ncbi:hypothetical protein MMC07_005443 [Pseudocyphellaria aurata]|nr:hypothetical protein [Pseudocyphellaria aurata]
MSLNSPVSAPNGYLACSNKEQQIALQALRKFPNEAVQCFLIYARSIEPPSQDQLRTQHHLDILTKEELEAIWILRDCPDSLISGSVNPTDGSQNNKVSTSNRTPKIACWCTGCSPPRYFKGKDGWARHEREKHEEHVYTCLPNGVIEATAQGPVCAICKMPDPDKNHLDDHNIWSCIDNSSSAHVYKRRIDLVNHLKLNHGVLKGQHLAEDWKRAPDKKAWACGFCVSHFPQFMDRINHIYAEHYAQGVDMRSWDPVKVIQGLLRQPRLADAWSKHLLARYPSGQPELTWHSSALKSLQGRLEMGVESPEILVAAAYDQSNLGPDFWANEPISFNVDTDVKLLANDAVIHQYPHSSTALQDFNYNYNGSDTPYEPGSSTMDMAKLPCINDSSLNAESTNYSTEMFGPPIYQTPQQTFHQLDDGIPHNDAMENDGAVSLPEFFDEDIWKWMEIQ